MESKLVVDLDEGESVDAASGPNPPAHHYWSKDVGKQKGIGSWRRLDGGQKRRAGGKAEMVTVADEPSHLSLSLSHKKADHTSQFLSGRRHCSPRAS